MPTYEYACTACGNEWEFEQSIKADALKECPACHAATAKRQISRGVGFILKGSGWYADAYSGSSNQKAEKTEKASAAGDKAAATAPAASDTSGSASTGAAGSSATASTGTGSTGSGSSGSGSSGSGSSGPATSGGGSGTGSSPATGGSAAPVKSTPA